MASPGNRHCASCIGTLSFPVNSTSTRGKPIGERLRRHSRTHAHAYVRTDGRTDRKHDAFVGKTGWAARRLKKSTRISPYYAY